MPNNERVLIPADDGVTHINIWTKAKTRLGRLLTNLADIPVSHPKYGTFRTGEGLWYYLKTGCCEESLRALTGFDAKKVGRELPNVWLPEFQAVFMESCRLKLEGHPELKELFLESELPFEHYYVYGEKIHEPRDVRWLTKFWTDLRDELKM